jgi:hypothetical protein
LPDDKGSPPLHPGWSQPEGLLLAMHLGWSRFSLQAFFTQNGLPPLGAQGDWPQNCGSNFGACPSQARKGLQRKSRNKPLCGL